MGSRKKSIGMELRKGGDGWGVVGRGGVNPWGLVEMGCKERRWGCGRG